SPWRFASSRAKAGCSNAVMSNAAINDDLTMARPGTPILEAALATRVDSDERRVRGCQARFDDALAYPVGCPRGQARGAESRSAVARTEVAERLSDTA